MVYKIQGNFNEDNFEMIFKKLGSHFKLMYKHNTLYAALIDYGFVDKNESYLRNTLKPSKNFYICKIDEKNIMNEDQSVIAWCRDSLVGLDRQKYEREQQIKLREVMEAMDNMENILQQKLLAQTKGKNNKDFIEERKEEN